MNRVTLFNVWNCSRTTIPYLKCGLREPMVAMDFKVVFGDSVALFTFLFCQVVKQAVEQRQNQAEQQRPPKSIDRKSIHEIIHQQDN